MYISLGKYRCENRVIDFRWPLWSSSSCSMSVLKKNKQTKTLELREKNLTKKARIFSFRWLFVSNIDSYVVFLFIQNENLYKKKSILWVIYGFTFTLFSLSYYTVVLFVFFHQFFFSSFNHYCYHRIRILLDFISNWTKKKKKRKQANRRNTHKKNHYSVSNTWPFFYFFSVSVQNLIDKFVFFLVCEYRFSKQITYPYICIIFFMLLIHWFVQGFVVVSGSFHFFVL